MFKRFVFALLTGMLGRATAAVGVTSQLYCGVCTFDRIPQYRSTCCHNQVSEAFFEMADGQPCCAPNGSNSSEFYDGHPHVFTGSNYIPTHGTPSDDGLNIQMSDINACRAETGALCDAVLPPCLRPVLAYVKVTGDEPTCLTSGIGRIATNFGYGVVSYCLRAASYSSYFGFDNITDASCAFNGATGHLIGNDSLRYSDTYRSSLTCSFYDSTVEPANYTFETPDAKYNVTMHYFLSCTNTQSAVETVPQ